MKIRYLSDLHLEFENEKIEDYFDIGENADAIVIAGDLHVSRGIVNCIQRLVTNINNIPLLYVTGNHDYYHGNTEKVNSQLAHLDVIYNNFHFLNKKSVIINDILFIGATGWQSFPTYTQQNYYMMNDFNYIDDHSDNVLVYGRRDKAFIEQELKVNDGNRKAVVITHLPPTISALDLKSYENRIKGTYLHAYYNEHDDLLKTYKPDFWICGHSHDTFFDIIEDTLVCRNALGYIRTDRENLEFDKDSFLLC